MKKKEKKNRMKDIKGKKTTKECGEKKKTKGKEKKKQK